MEAGGRRTGWLADRSGWSDLVRPLEARRVSATGFDRYLGGITLLLFLIEVASGILLLLYYKPDTVQAYASVGRIVGEIPYGNLIRNVHAWSSDLFVASLGGHLLSVVLRRAYRAPYELRWLSGIVLLAIGIGLAFTGAVLPWSQKAYVQARVGSELARYVPVLGDWLHRFLRGGDEVTSATLQHAFGFHVAVLPAALSLFFAVHVVLLMRKREETAPVEGASIPVYPDFIIRQAAAWTGVVVAVITLATFSDRLLGSPADPRMATPSDARPPWYFLWFHQIVASSSRDLLGVNGPKFLVGTACLLGALVVGLPFLDRRGWKVTAYLALVLVFVLVVLSVNALS